MTGRKIITILIIIDLILVGIIYNLISKVNLNGKKQVIKEMTEIEYEDYITSLNTSHEDYAKYIEESKKKIASAITNMGVYTTENADATTMANNIGKVLQTKTSDATATADDIKDGKTAYVNGEKITGNVKENNTSMVYYLGNCSAAGKYEPGSGTFDVSSISGYENFTVDNFICCDNMKLYGYVVYPNRPFQSSAPTKSYNASTGIFTIKLPSAVTSLSDSYGGNHYMNSGSAKVYLVTGEIINMN